MVVLGGGAHGQRGDLHGARVLQVAPGPFVAVAGVVEGGVVGDEVAGDRGDARVGEVGGELLVVLDEHARVARAAQVQVAVDDAVHRAVPDDLGGERVVGAEDLESPCDGGDLVVGGGDGALVPVVVVDDFTGGGVLDQDVRLGVDELGVGQDRVDRGGEGVVAGLLRLGDHRPGDGDGARGSDRDGARNQGAFSHGASLVRSNQ